MLWSAATAREIGADWLAAEIAPAGELGRRARERERPFRRGDEAAARASLERVSAVAAAHSAAVLDALHGLLASIPDPAAILVRAQSGGSLADADFFELLRFFDAMAQAPQLASGARFPPLEFDAPLKEAADLLRIGRTPARSFYLAGAYDPALQRVRDAAESAQTRYDAARSRLFNRVARELGRETLGGGEFVVMRDALAGALPASVHVVREAPTYLLCELALDEEALAALGALTDASEEVANKEDAVRARLSAAIVGASASIEQALRVLGEIDSLTARARFAQRYAAGNTQIADGGKVAFNEARFPPLEMRLKAGGHSYTPISLELDGVGALTGPNMGGKTAALRTCGFVAACVALGVPVPAQSASVSLYHEIAWIGAGGTLEEGTLLSAFGQEVVELQRFLDSGAAGKLALIDEFARTTSPREGRALLVALLEVLRERGTAALAATHFPHVAESAQVPHYAIAGLRALPEPPANRNLELDDALDRIAQLMDYRVARVVDDALPQADALALADVLGLDGELIARARAAL